MSKAAVIAATHKLRAEFAVDTIFAIAPLPDARFGGGGDASTTTFFLAGGYNSSNATTSTLYAYDVVANTWTTKTGAPATGGYERAAFAAGFLYYHVGPQGFYRYDPVANTWSAALAIMPVGSSQSWDVALPDGSAIYVIGGNAASAGAVTRRYDTAAGTWTTETPKPTAGHSASARGPVGSDGLIYCPHVVHEAYDPVGKTWTTKASPAPTLGNPTYWTEFTSEHVGGRILAFGGQTSLATAGTKAVLAYDIATNAWANLGDYFATNVFHLRSGVVGPRIFLSPPGTPASTLANRFIASFPAAYQRLRALVATL